MGSGLGTECAWGERTSSRDEGRDGEGTGLWVGCCLRDGVEELGRGDLDVEERFALMGVLSLPVK
jgi:hypothetical protein